MSNQGPEVVPELVTIRVSARSNGGREATLQSLAKAFTVQHLGRVDNATDSLAPCDIVIEVTA